METSAPLRQFYRFLFVIGMIALVGGVCAGIYESLRDYGIPPHYSYQVLQDEAIATLVKEGKYAEVVEQQRLAATYGSPFASLQNGSPAEYGELCLAWYAQGVRDDDTFSLHRAALCFLTMRDLQQQPTAEPLPAKLQARLNELEPIRTQQWDIANPRFFSNLAWTMATSTVPQERYVAGALAFAQEACKLSSYRDPIPLDTLAVAYAANKKFPEAIRYAQQAIDQAQSSGIDPQRIVAMQKRLELYKKGIPYLEKPNAEGPGY